MRRACHIAQDHEKHCATRTGDKHTDVGRQMLSLRARRLDNASHTAIEHVAAQQCEGRPCTLRVSSADALPPMPLLSRANATTW